MTTKTKTKRSKKPAAKTPDKVLILRTCNADMTSRGGFVWPASGPVEAPDWNPAPKCGNGLHGFLWGEGDGSLADWSSDARWLVVSVDAHKVVDLCGKVKFQSGDVVFCGDRAGATGYLISRLKKPAKVIGAVVSSGDGGTSTSGYWGTSTSGECGTSTSGYRGTSTSGDWGTSTSGDWGTSTSGYCGTSTSGHRGTSTSGYSGTSTSGDCGTSTSGDRGTASAGRGGTLSILWYDSVKQKWRRACAEVGENGIKPNVTYRVTDEGKFVEVSK